MGEFGGRSGNNRGQKSVSVLVPLLGLRSLDGITLVGGFLDCLSSIGSGTSGKSSKLGLLSPIRGI